MAFGDFVKKAKGGLDEAKEKAKKEGLDKAAKQLVEKQGPKVVEATVKALAGETGLSESKVRGVIADIGAKILKEQANTVIPEPLQTETDKIIEIAMEKLVDFVFDQVKAQIGL